MIIGLIIFGLILFGFAFGVVYIITYFPILWIFKTDNLKRVRIIISGLGGLLITSFYLFISPTNNNEIVTIENYGDKFLVTLTGDRLLMTHDPISFLRRSTYTDTLHLIIPRDKGKINGSEIPIENGYKMTGTLNIDGERMKVDLYYDNYDDKIMEPLGWNDNYKIKLK